MSIQKQSWTIISNNLEKNSNFLRIDGDEHHYAFHVLRIKEGDKVEITNCQGLKAEGIIASANKKNISINIQKVCSYPKSKPEINLWLAMTKPTTLDEIIANSSEMGASQIHIFRSDKAASKAPLKIEKARQLSNEATRISKSSYASEISYYESLENFYEQYILKSNSKKLVLFCDECHIYEGKIKNSIFSEIKSHFKKDMDEICILIGPEASFSNKERDFIQKNLNCFPVSLGNNILRVPNASASALGVAINFRNDFI